MKSKQMEKRFFRPLLCRLCECPVADGGVRLSQVDRDKLSEWWLLHLDTHLDDEDLENVWICQFCKWDARLEHDFSDENDLHENCDWWTTAKTKELNYNHYLGDLIQPCFVDVSNKLQLKTSTTEKDHREISFTPGRRRIESICNYCKVKLESKKSLARHIKSFHKGIMKVWCRRCATVFSTSKELKEHSAKFHDKKCIYCKKRNFKTNLELMKHTMEIHKRKPIQCNYNQRCGNLFKNEIELQEHISKFHESGETKKKCFFCNKMIAGMYLHIKNNHKSEATIKCDYYHCATYFKSEEERLIHVKKIHESGEKLKTCIYCLRKFNKKAYSDHIARIHKSEAIKCNFGKGCATFFLSTQEKEKHISVVHKAEKYLENVSCIYCNRKFSGNLNLESHITSKHSDVKIRCKLYGCFQYFFTQTEHEKHFVKMHSDKDKLKILKCAFCNYKCAKSTNLREHVAHIHGTENIKCPKCPKYCNSKESLKKHWYMVHKREAKICVHCNFAFKNKIHTKRHFCVFCNKLNLCSGQRRKHANECKRK